MKKFLFVIAAALIASVCFGQKAQNLHQRVANSVISPKATNWYGNATGQYVQDMEANDYFVIRPEVFAGANEAGEQVTKVKFYTISPAELTGSTVDYSAYTSMSFTISILEGTIFDEGLLTQGYTVDDASYGTTVYTQNYTAADYGEQEVTLTTPYTITNANYWVKLACNGQSLLLIDLSEVISTGVTVAEFQAQTYPTLTIEDFSASQYLLFKNDQYMDLDVSYGLAYGDGNLIYYFYQKPYFQIFVQGSGEYQANSDIQVAVAKDWTEGTESYSLNGLYANNETVTISTTDDLPMLALLYNNGPDAADNIVSFDVTIDGASLINGPVPFDLTSTPMPAGSGTVLADLSLTAADMDMYELTNFTIVYTAEYAGVDNVPANNTLAINVVRTDGPTAVEENAASAVSVYPNPANDMFTVANVEGATIEVVNALGQVVSRIENANANQTINASNFANGTYFVRVNAEVIKINVVK